MVQEFKEIFSTNSRRTLVAVHCLLCNTSIGMCKSISTSRGRLVLDVREVKIGVTMCFKCGNRSGFGRMRSHIDINRVRNKDIVRRLEEGVTRNNGTLSYINDMVYLKFIVNEVTCELFTLIPSTKCNGGARVHPSVCSDMIRW